MGMFDDIMVPKSYLKGLLDKGYEKYLSTNHTFQTKDFESMMDVYKVERQHLYLKEYPRLGDSFVYDKRKKKQKQKWKKLTETITVNFYDSIQNEKGDNVWLEFDFSFVNGKLDKKKLIKAEISETKEEIKNRNEMWEIENEIYNRYRRKFKVRFFEKLYYYLQKLNSWVAFQYRISEKVTKKAHEASGRNE